MRIKDSGSSKPKPKPQSIFNRSGNRALAKAADWANRRSLGNNGSANAVEHRLLSKPKPNYGKNGSANAAERRILSSKKMVTNNAPAYNPSRSNSGVRPSAPINIVRNATPKPAARPAPKPVAKAPAKKMPAPSPVNRNPAPPVGNTPPVRQVPASGDPYAEYRQQATSIYQPQLTYLTGLEDQNRRNAATADTAIGGMYGKLEKDIRGQVGAVAQNYNGAISDVNRNVDQAKANINANYDASRNAQMETLKRLGIQEAAPQTLAQQGADQAFYTSGQDRARSNATNLLTTQRAADTDFTNAQASISAQTGVDKRAQVQRSLQDILGQLSGKKADTQSSIASQTISLKNLHDQQAAAQAQAQRETQLAYDRMANDAAIAKAKLDLQSATTRQEYDFKNRQLQQAMVLGQGNLALGQQRLAQQQEASRGQLLLGQSRLGVESENAKRTAAARIQAAQLYANSRSGAQNKVDPWTQAESLASTLYPNTQAAGNAVNAIRDTVLANQANGTQFPKFTSPAQFIQAVAARNKNAFKPGGDGPQLAKLATMLYKNIYG